MLQGNADIAHIYAENAVRKAQERLNLLRLSSRIDAVASRIQTAVAMKGVSKNMAVVVRGMDRAMESMNLEEITKVMDSFESHFEDLETATGYYESAARDMAVSEGQAQGSAVDLLVEQLADEAGVELQQKMGPTPVQAPPKEAESGNAVHDDLNERLRALRN